MWEHKTLKLDKIFSHLNVRFGILGLEYKDGCRGVDS